MRPGGRLRHLGARRGQLLTSIVSEIQQIRALLECVWPAALECAQQPFRSQTWTRAMHIVCDRGEGDLARTRRLGPTRFEQAVRREIVKRGGQKPCRRIVGRVFAALADPVEVLEHRRDGLEQVQLLLADWAEDQRRLADTETRMLAVLDELHLTELVTSIPGVSAIGAAAVLAETGDPRRFISARAVVKHAGLAPRQKLSGSFRRADQTHRAGPTPAAARRVAGGLGRAAHQHRLRRQIPAPHQPREEQAHPHPGAERDRRGGAAAAARRHHDRQGMGPSRRQARHPTKATNIHRRLTIHVAADKLTDGASPTRH
jgi:hypothetical protein